MSLVVKNVANALVGDDKLKLISDIPMINFGKMLGNGKRLFPDGKRVNLKLIKSSALPTGVVYQRYQPAE